jgi:large subunit ribosomal protein L18
MNEIAKRTLNREQRANRTRTKLRVNNTRPRLTVTISNKNVHAQIIDDSKGTTLVSSTSLTEKSLAKSSLSDKSSWVGADIAKKAKAAKIQSVVFDRGFKLYHGRVKSVAEAARKEGLEF